LQFFLATQTIFTCLMKQNVIPKTRDSDYKTFLLILIPICVVLLAYSSNTVDVVLMPKFLCYAIFTIVMCIAAYFVSNNKPQYFQVIISSIYFKVYFLFLLTSFIGVFFSCNYADAIFEWLKIFLFGTSTFCCAIYFFDKNKKVEYFVKSINIANIIIAIIGLYQFINIANNTDISHSITYAVTATFGHKNIFAEILFITLPFTFYNIIYGNKVWKFIGGIGALLTLFLITISLTRAVWLSTIFGFIFSYLIYRYYQKQEFKNLFFSNKSKLYITLAVIVSILVSVFIYSRLDTFKTFQKQAISIVYFKYGSGAERLQLWQKSISVFKENPIFGGGLGSWKIMVLNYGHNGLETENNKTFHQRPHNDFLWILCEQGLVGLILYLALVTLIIYSIVFKIKNAISNSEQFFFFLMLYVYFGYLIFSFFSFPKERIEHNIILTFIFAFALIPQQKFIDTTTNKLLHYVVFSTIAAINIYAIRVGFIRYNSEVHLQKAYTARAKENWQKVIDEIDKASNIYFAIDPMCTPIKWYSGSAQYNLGNQEMAFMDFNTSYQQNPNHIHVLNNLGTSFEIKGEHNQAIKMYERALQISPLFVDAQLNLAATYFNAGNKLKSFDVFTNILPDTNNEKYMQMLPLIVDAKCKIMVDTMKCLPLKMTIEAINNVPLWKQDVYFKSKQNNISFDQQIITDAIFVIDNIDRKQNEAYINSLIKKYKIIENTKK